MGQHQMYHTISYHDTLYIGTQLSFLRLVSYHTVYHILSWYTTPFLRLDWHQIIAQRLIIPYPMKPYHVCSSQQDFPWAGQPDKLAWPWAGERGGVPLRNCALQQCIWGLGTVQQRTWAVLCCTVLQQLCSCATDTNFSSLPQTWVWNIPWAGANSPTTD